MGFAEKMRSWLPLHQHPINRAVHLAGGFMFVFALWVPLSLFGFEVDHVWVTPARVLTFALMAYGIFLERTAGVVFAILLVPLLRAAESVAALTPAEALTIAFTTMALRFGIVISGHVAFERKTHGLKLGGPILFFVEPVYLFTQLMFGLGWKRALLSEVQKPLAVPAK